MEAPWSRDKNQMLKQVNVHPEHGLDKQNVESSHLKFGKNILSESKRISHFQLILRQFKNPMTLTLLLATVVALILGEFLDACAILIIVLINSLIGYIHESKAEASLEALKKNSVPRARVIRDGEIKSIEAYDVVPADILHLEAGDYVVADARVLLAHQLSADEAILTGESLPVKKSDHILPLETVLAERKNMLFASTAISSGSGKALVTHTGMNTEIGRIAGLLESSHYQLGPLQRRLEKVNRYLLYIGLAVIVLVAILGMMKGDSWSIILMAAISLSVAAIPEGLPTVVTLALTLATRRMTKRNVIIRNMGAVETLGSTDIICTDKTGTLTTGKMRVREVFSIEKGLVDEKTFQGPDEFYKSLVFCNNASLGQGESGDPTEVALLYLVESQGKDIDVIRKSMKRIDELSFDSDRKLMSVVAQDNKKIVFTKGAPESLINICLLSEEEKLKISQEVQHLSSLGRRTLALAWKELKNQNEKIEKDLHFLALVGIADPPKEETIPAIATCKASGIKVIMITGDHPITAKVIAQELGITEIGSFDGVLTGSDLDKMSLEELQKKAEQTAVYARVTPEHKLKIIQALQNNGHIVAMTGDGVNDAPALKTASIGVAMGKAGTEVARQASSMILTDDNFASIVSAVEEGRAIYGNIKRTIQYLLSTNLAELLIVLGATALGYPMPLAPLALLWINLVTDGFPSLALASEPVPHEFLKSSPGPSPSNFFDKIFVKELLFVAFINTAMALSLYRYLLITSDVLTSKSMMFTFLVYLCLFRSFSCRSENKTFFQLKFNPWHLGSVIGPVVLQLLIQHTQLFQHLFKVRALSSSENILLLTLSLLPVTFLEILKLWSKK